MELIFRSAATALTVAVLSLVIKKTNPEMSLLLSLCTVCVILIAVLGISKSIRELADAVKQIYGASESFVAPVIKCLAISILTKISCELCKEASQNAASSALDLAGTLCALTVAMPMIMSMLKMIGGMI